MKRGDIYYIHFNKKGNVQTGTRPVIVVQNDKGNQFSPTTIVCSITSAPKKYVPTHLFIGKSGGLNKESTVLCEQIQTVNKIDLKFYAGSVTNPRTLCQLDQKIRISLGIGK